MTSPDAIQTTSPQNNDAAPPSTRFNAAMLVGDVSFYMIGMAFLDTSTALPAIVRSLGGDATFLGLVLALRQAMSYLAPVLIAHHLQGLVYFKPTLIRVSLLGRLFLFPAVLCLYLFGSRYPALCLGVLTLAMMAAWLGDGAGAVPWTALVGKMIPARQRGRLFAVTQMFAGITRLFISAGVAVLLSGRLVAFPHNMALLVLCCAISLGISWVFIASFREPIADATTVVSESSEGFVSYLRSLPKQMKEHPTFSLIAIVQIFLSATGAGMPFVVGYAESLGTHLPTHLPFGSEQLQQVFAGGLPGLFLAVQTCGMLVCAPVWGWVNDRLGPKRAIVGLLITSCLCPILALFAGLTGGNLGLFLLAYFCFGATMDWWIPITNYLIESVPTEKQATFLGLMSTASSPALLLPLIGGFLMEKGGGIAVLVETLLLLLVGATIALRLPSTRRH